MGNTISGSALALLAVEGPSTPMAVFDKRFCMNTKTVLKIRENVGMYSRDKSYVIRDPTTNVSYFKLDAKVGNAAVSGAKVTVKTLSDIYNSPVWHMSPDDVQINNFSIYDGKKKGHAFDIVSMAYHDVPHLKVVFTDASGQVCEAGIRGDLHQRSCAIWVDIGQKGKKNRLVVAKVIDEEKQPIPLNSSPPPANISPPNSSPPTSIVQPPSPANYVANRMLAANGLNRSVGSDRASALQRNRSINNLTRSSGSQGSPPSPNIKSYIVEIAPNVDIAFVVNLMIAMDDYQRYHIKPLF